MLICSSSHPERCSGYPDTCSCHLDLKEISKPDGHQTKQIPLPMNRDRNDTWQAAGLNFEFRIEKSFRICDAEAKKEEEGLLSRLENNLPSARVTVSTICLRDITQPENKACKPVLSVMN
jgi:hypothetical protein